MQNISIENLQHNQIKGVTVMLPVEGEPYKENYFEWRASDLTAIFNTKEVTGGVLQAWHHTPVFSQIETHIDREMFYFTHGSAIMLFIDIMDDKPNMETAQIVRICPGTQIIIDSGKGHFIAVAEDNEPVYAVVVSPKMDAPRMLLPEDITGV